MVLKISQQKIRCRQYGFTLIELMLVVAIVSIVAGIALPYFGETIRNQRVRAVATDLMSTFMVARSDSRRFGAQLSVVAPANNYNQGWCVVFGNAADCNPANPDPNVMKVATPARDASVAPSASTPNRVVIERTGRLAAPACFDVDDGRATPVFRRRVEIQTSGSVAIENGACP